MNKIVTICGSMKFKYEMLRVAQRLELEERYAVIQCVYFSKERMLSQEEVDLLSELHYKKIEINDKDSYRK